MDKLWWSIVLVAPALVGALAAQLAVPPLARLAAAELDSVGRALAPRVVAEPPLTFVESEVAAFPISAVAESRVASAPARARAAAKVVPKKGVFVRATKVLALANAGARPSGVSVPARGARPAGVLLVGVNGLGVGLRDGDVLTHAGGRPASSVGEVVGVVLGARARRVEQIGGRFWRDGESWNLIVEQPYVEKPVRSSESRPAVSRASEQPRDGERG